VASLLDLLATKLKVLLQSVLTLNDGLAAAKALYGVGFPLRECLKALVYFADGDLPELGMSERQRLEQAVLAVDAIPNLERIGKELVRSPA